MSALPLTSLLLLALTASAEHSMSRPRLSQRQGGNNNRPILISNWCTETIYPAILTQGGTGPSTTGYAAQPNTNLTVYVSSDWQGRVWGRTNCTFSSSGGGGSSCTTGDCGGLQACKGPGVPPATLAEFTLAGSQSQDFYDISLYDRNHFSRLFDISASDLDLGSVDVCDLNIDQHTSHHCTAFHYNHHTSTTTVTVTQVQVSRHNLHLDHNKVVDKDNVHDNNGQADKMPAKWQAGGDGACATSTSSQSHQNHDSQGGDDMCRAYSDIVQVCSSAEDAHHASDAYFYVDYLEHAQRDEDYDVDFYENTEMHYQGRE
ncbi:hypothetical protein LTR02_002590 [Friedmanniomyces endolithicus]|nr:hypothetical protein LTR75_012995 [Friedmanniomyces endolithicus]KAK0790981.1 hypothetical protein LTR59_009061 [Friedmanniomyces endolithicus]KAK0797171.1 hypothetical protein LTR38_008307 [Friedmanniomyces endolithicus]KAK0839173.1 hypothetical protein LTR03_011431 [Friedmanniomyces endolithicus]KAK0849565.1 hypothetical protein LTS02_013535 [Friedmanniomyces endolithicus]